MITYSNFQPTPFDSKGAFLPEKRGWYVAPCTRSRDSDNLSESNFFAQLKELGEEDFEVFRFGHWGNGWFEIVLVKPYSMAYQIALEIENKLSDYHVLDESDFSEREYSNEENE